MAEALETIAIPRTNLNPTRIALGTWAIGGWMWGGTDEAESIRTIRSAVDRGINLIDTAPVYGFGRSEEIVGEALAKIGRDKVLIATKPQRFQHASQAQCPQEGDRLFAFVAAASDVSCFAQFTEFGTARAKLTIRFPACRHE